MTNKNLANLQLLKAIEKGHLAETKRALEAGADMYARERGRALASDAVVAGQVSIVGHFLKKGLDPNFQDHPNISLLGLAAQASPISSKRIASMLMKRGAKWDLKDALGDNIVLSSAAKEGNAELAELVLEQAPILSSKEMAKAFPWIVRNFSSEEASRLTELAISKGAQVPPAAAYQAALQGATSLSKLMLANLLVKAGEETILKDLVVCIVNRWDEGEAVQTLPSLLPLLPPSLELLTKALTGAAKRCSLPLLDLLFNHYSIFLSENMDAVDGGELILALCQGNADKEPERCYQILREKGCHIDGEDRSEGDTPLHAVSKHCGSKGHLDLQKLLLRDGADPLVLNALSSTALHSAASGGNTEAMGVFLDHGCDINEAPSGHTPLHEATYQGKLEVIKLLLERGADLDVENAFGLTAEGWAAQSREPHAETVMKAIAGERSRRQLLQLEEHLGASVHRGRLRI